MIFGVLMVIWRHRKFDGQLFWLYPLFYSILRFILEFVRGDADRGLHFGGLISTSQVIAVFVLGFSGFMLSRLSKTSNENDDRRTHIGA